MIESEILFDIFLCSRPAGFYDYLFNPLDWRILEYVKKKCDRK